MSKDRKSLVTVQSSSALVKRSVKQLLFVAWVVYGLPNRGRGLLDGAGSRNLRKLMAGDSNSSNGFLAPEESSVRKRNLSSGALQVERLRCSLRLLAIRLHISLEHQKCLEVTLVQVTGFTEKSVRIMEFSREESS